MIVLEVPIPLSSGNDHVVNGRDRVVGSIYRRRRDTWAGAVRTVARSAGVALLDARPFVDEHGRVIAPRPRRKVTIVRMIGKGQREWDGDNMVAACKALRDACQVPRNFRKRWVAGAAIVVDDSPKWSEWSYRQERATNGVASVRLEIEEP